MNYNRSEGWSVMSFFFFHMWVVTVRVKLSFKNERSITYLEINKPAKYVAAFDVRVGDGDVLGPVSKLELPRMYFKLPRCSVLAWAGVKLHFDYKFGAYKI